MGNLSVRGAVALTFKHNCLFVIPSFQLYSVLTDARRDIRRTAKRILPCVSLIFHEEGRLRGIKY